MADISTELYYILKENAGVAALVASRIYPLTVPQGAAMPAITYQEIGAPREHTFADVLNCVGATFQVTCWGETYSSAKEVAEAVRAVLDAFSGTASAVAIQGAFLQNEVDLSSPSAGVEGRKRTGKALDFLIRYEE